MQNFKFVLLLALGAMLFTACGGGGSGSDNVPVPDPKVCVSHAAVAGEAEIRTAAELAGIASTGKYILVNDIALTGKWTPIAPFEGELDGNCYTISGLSITTAEVPVPDINLAVSAGLFSSINNAKISRLSLADVDIDIAYTLDYQLNIGSIVGSVTNSEITDSHSTGLIIAASDRNTLFIGGLLGFSDNTTTTDSDSAVDISATTSPNEGDSISRAGGIAGYARNSKFKNTYNTGAIKAATETSNSVAPAYAGGIVGNAFTTVDISNSYNTGAISATTAGSVAYAGGIMGRNQDLNIIISSSYNTGKVMATSQSSYAEAGGIAGQHVGEISDSYSTGDVEAKSDSSYANAGGIAGTIQNNSASISNAYSTGTIVADGGTSVGNAGGIAGYAFGSTLSIEYCAAINPTITANTSAGPIVGIKNNASFNNNVPRSDMNISGATPNTDGFTSGKTLAELQSQSTYEELGWNFTNIWKMGADYPVLQWQE